ncbi:V-type ATPase V1 subunit H [Schizosaccharomyces cryophilus OY26]|uniref:V-type proton ATPase subunit H n=1 Tax=Schizosaccharomyces cryophilus (strain OY26 / ATCC MYA-4695 / CBS 11777 / NBRC 106824 / NRRL Y48691) TaxID=653667 RepID=S9VXW0_SCHCR|nr:V-type ATPase V1 subunit H [Schizosaccharomyces cryophilus OY26]EPY52428.1 V-type ATPase V1 subunit H [Schizosaccharomyces cryophilus OY26]
MPSDDISFDNVASPPPAVLDNPRIDSIVDNARSAAIPWHGYQRSGILSENEYGLVSDIIGKPLDVFKRVIESDVKVYTNLFLKLFSLTMNPDIVNYAFVKVADALLNSKEFSYFFIPLFFKFLKENETYFENLDTDGKLLFAQVFALANLYVACSCPKMFTVFLEYLSKLMTSTDNYLCLFATQCLAAMLNLKAHRYGVWAEGSCPYRLAEILRSSSADSQLQYYSLFCFWLLTFESPIAKEANKPFDLIKVMVHIARSDTKTKVYRMILAIFSNLLQKAPNENIFTMLLENVDKAVKLLQRRKWADEEILSYMDFIISTLEVSSQHLSTFDIYKSEIESGQLHWSPSHRSEQFWIENAKKLNSDNYSLLKKLFQNLQNHGNPTSLAVACHDLGAYITYYPEGKSVLVKYGMKQRIMELMSHPNPEIRFEALNTVQRLMTEVWNN